MKKRVLVFCVALIALFVICVSAAEPLDFSSQTENISGNGWRWDASRRILYLNSVSLSSETETIHLPKNSSIVYSGTCSVTATAGTAIVADGVLSIVCNTSGSLTVSGTTYGITGPETVLNGNDISVSGRRAASTGLVEAESGLNLLVSNGQGFLPGAYQSQRMVRTGALYPVYVSVGVGGGASFYTDYFAAGQEVVLTARPEIGYGISSWTSPNVTISDPSAETIRFTMPKGPVRVFGTFEKVYNVTIPELEGGHVEVETFGPYRPGQQVILYAVPDTGYYFSHWTSDYGRFRDPLQAYAALTMPNVDVVATPVFVKGQSYSLRVEVRGEGKTNVTIGNFPQNKSVLLRAEPAEGYVFSGWISESGTFRSSADAITYYTMPGENAVITAVFSPSEESKKDLTVEQRTGGTVNLTGGLFAPGSPIQLAARPKTGYRFVRWEVTPAEFSSAVVDLKSEQTELIMPREDIQIAAVFELLDSDAVTFYFTLGSTEGGSVTGEATGNYLAGYEIELYATPDEGYYFAGWKSALGGEFVNPVDPNTVFRMPANDTKVMAYFEPIAPETPVAPTPPDIGIADDKPFDTRPISFGIGVASCSLVAAGGTWYSMSVFERLQLKHLFRRRRRRNLKKMRCRRD